MITIGVELNDVVRDIKKQMLKYFKKEFGSDYDPDDIESSEDIFEKGYIKFNSKKDEKNFIYIDYPYELFGCAKPMEKNLPTKINQWLTDMSNIDDEEFRVIYFSMDEEALTIQSSFFFLSKIGTRVREVLFPQNIDEIKGKFDFVVSANNDIINKLGENGVKTIKIKKDWNTETKCDFEFDSLSDVVDDENFLNKIVEIKKNG
jgi:hypothetical protein